jgi:hypothetical protein
MSWNARYKPRVHIQHPMHPSDFLKRKTVNLIVIWLCTVNWDGEVITHVILGAFHGQMRPVIPLNYFMPIEMIPNLINTSFFQFTLNSTA